MIFPCKTNFFSCAADNQDRAQTLPSRTGLGPGLQRPLIGKLDFGPAVQRPRIGELVLGLGR
jgi:hypothetical protein